MLMTSAQNVRFRFTGLDIEGSDTGDIEVSQEDYLKHIYFISEDKKEDKGFGKRRVQEM